MKQKYILILGPKELKKRLKLLIKKITINIERVKRLEKNTIWVRRHRDKIKLNPEKHAKLKLELNLRNRIRSVMKTK